MNQSYVSIVYTAHYLGDHGLKRVLLHLDKFFGTTSSDSLLNEFAEDILARHNIAQEKVVAVVTDTTGNMGKFGKLLRDTYDVEQIYCVDHQIHRTAILAREDRYIPQGNGTMKCFRNLMQIFNSSTQALEKLLTSMKAANLPPLKTFQDNVTRWWSTYKSISRYLDNGVGDHITLLISHGEIVGFCVDLSPTHGTCAFFYTPWQKHRTHLKVKNIHQFHWSPTVLITSENFFSKLQQEII